MGLLPLVRKLSRLKSSGFCNDNFRLQAFTAGEPGVRPNWASSSALAVKVMRLMRLSESSHGFLPPAIIPQE
jgi:hypothetical protein